MEKKNQNILLCLIVVVILAAVFSSFGLPYFTGGTPEIVLPTPRPTADGAENGWADESQGVRVEVTPETVQGVVAALNRQESYMRNLTTTLEESVTTVGVWVDRGWVRTDLTTPAGVHVHTIVGDGSVWRWHGADTEVLTWSGDDYSGDADGQRIPTYEDVLELETERITAAGYEEKNGLPCVYVEAAVPELNQIERYWVSADNGLLEAAETEVEGRVVWTMSASEPEIPAPATAVPFTLPDGQVLHDISQTERLAADQTSAEE